ncbi:hypothetical protein [Leucobacter chironomi]|uniref:hypothetical protein n=1 Tax=Leucobacter chironomi TaxID=491918 RepID=UPI001268336F|nr:hypothetical protein [Leucobacter chironomi]
MTQIFGRPRPLDVRLSVEDGVCTVETRTDGPLSTSKSWEFGIEIARAQSGNGSILIRCRFEPTRANWVDVLDEHGIVLRAFEDVNGKILHNSNHVTFIFDATAIDLPEPNARVRAWSRDEGSAPTDADYTDWAFAFTS